VIHQQPLLCLQNLLFQRDWQVILSPLNLQLKPGQWVILRGKNGCGKTTLLKLAAGLLRPTAGKITLFGSCSYLGHSNGIKPTQTLNGILQSLSVDSQHSTDLVSILALNEYGDVPFHQLSAGLKRRVALVQLLAPEVDLYIVDEPLDNLDPLSSQLVWQVMAGKIQAGAAILMAHHGLNPVAHPAIAEVFLDA
jgi:heme exporter protein A